MAAGEAISFLGEGKRGLGVLREELITEHGLKE